MLRWSPSCAAGAVILGKTVTTQFAHIDPAATRNPWNLAHTPGGSSSGSAAAVAAEMCWAAVGTQTGGSVIRPAAFCGIVGVKPTFGSIDTTGVLPLSRELDTVGVMTTCVDDARVMLGVLQDRILPAAPADHAPLELGFVDEFFMAWAEEPVQEAVESAMEILRAAGARIHAVSLPASFTEVHQMHFRIMAHGAAETHREQFAQHEQEYAPRIAELIREGLAIGPTDQQESLSHQRRFTADMAAAFTSGEAAGKILDHARHRNARPGQSGHHRRPSFQRPLDIRRSAGCHDSLRIERRRIADRPTIGRRAQWRRTTPRRSNCGAKEN